VLCPAPVFDSPLPHGLFSSRTGDSVLCGFAGRPFHRGRRLPDFRAPRLKCVCGRFKYNRSSGLGRCSECVTGHRPDAFRAAPGCAADGLSSLRRNSHHGALFKNSSWIMQSGPSSSARHSGTQVKLSPPYDAASWSGPFSRPFDAAPNGARASGRPWHSRLWRSCEVRPSD